MRSTWRVIKKETRCSVPKKKNVSLALEGSEVTDPNSVVEKFNEYFTSLAEDLVQVHCQGPVPSFSSKSVTFNASMYVYETNPNEIISKIKSLSNKMSSGLDEIPDFILKACAHHIANPLAKIFNLSLKIGGSVITTRGTQTKQISVSLMGTSLCTQKNLPNRIIQANVLPGECWAFHGSSGSAAIKLITEIYLTAVTLEHIPQALSPTGERSSAPKEFSIWGITSVDSDEDAFCFGQFLYDLKGPPVQTFKVKNYSPKLYSMTEMRIHSNHGNPNYTCVYRLRIHGTINNMSCGVF
ncbi:SUN domain-containing protein 3-like [Schistocerca gregaria]|uniref:SUN domain-containing protein 3-like n=1 Tax=Schistocerca gregaria TaxID=7010 RepID=UPI00211EE9E4|nr:SUN domain-containing protein 3-like [Schistocerca gregaria]